MGSDFSRANAEALERALAAQRRRLDSIDAGDLRERRELALAAIEGYAALLREPLNARRSRLARYCFMLVFPDGRWSVDEKQLPDIPRRGDVVMFDGYGGWRIEGLHQVGAKPAGKPPREFFVCAPA